MNRLIPPILCVLCFFLIQSNNSVSADQFGVRFIDPETGRGVPLVEMETTNHIRFVSDSHGWVSISDPDLMNKTVWFDLKSHGYEFKKDGFGYAGHALKIEPDQTVEISVQRKNLAQRLYRVTGGGIYRDSVLLNKPVPIRNPLQSVNLTGCDSVMSIEHRNQIYWFWGDTVTPGYPIGGNFNITAATTAAPGDQDLDIEQGLNFDYITNNDNTEDHDSVKPVAKMPGEGPTWTGALTSIPDENGQLQIYSSYVKIRNSLESYRWGFVKWNDSTREFDEVVSFDERPKIFPEPQIHTFRHRDAGGLEHVYFTNPFPHLRVRARAEAYVDPTAYEGYTCLKLGTVAADRQLDRDEEGRLRFSFKTGTPPLSRNDVREFIEAGLISREESPFTLKDPNSGRLIDIHYGSVYWNDYLQQWIMIASEIGGESSFLGEVWFASSSNLNGPWKNLTKVLSHDNYTFYNPKQHPFFDADGGRLIYFEGTFTKTFANDPTPVPRYEYNQMMYKLDLDSLTIEK